MATVIGEITSDIIVRKTNREDGMEVANADISIFRANPDGSIEVGTRRGVFFGNLASHAKALLKPGVKVEVQGREAERDFETASGQIGLSYEIIANGFKVLPGNYDLTAQSAAQPIDEGDEDIPF
jgi:single-stranded DNA-binding protein